VLAIYPILPGQKADGKNVIPPRASEGNPSNANTANDTEDLIDFGDDNEAPKSEQTSLPASSTQNGEIRDLLQSTGNTPPPSQALEDFHKDLKKDLPKMKRSDTEESHDEFHDAMG
jgi:oxysterol-binding protein-related protein 8